MTALRAASTGNSVRVFQLLENCFNPLTLSDGSAAVGGATAPEIGDIMYNDKTWGKAADYNEAKNAGKIVNLKDLKFKDTNTRGILTPPTRMAKLTVIPAKRSIPRQEMVLI